jgi:CheY-like chemotaxis protein
LSFCEQYNGDIHLLLTDMVMPGLNGFELAKRAMLIRDDVRVIVPIAEFSLINKSIISKINIYYLFKAMSLFLSKIITRKKAKGFPLKDRSIV